MINSLNAAQSGLQTSKLAIDNISNNIANENTQGYVKRVANLSELSYDDNSYANGVGISSIERQVDEYLYNQLISKTSEESYYDSLSTIFELAETLFSETDESGLSKDLDNYFQAIENLRSDVSNEIYVAEVQSQASILVENMQSLYQDLEDIEKSNSKQLDTEVESMNQILNGIVNINQEISDHGESLDLLDKRDALELELSNYVDITVDRSSDYYKLSISDETAIFHNTLVYEVEVVQDPTAQLDYYDTDLLNDDNLTSGQTISLVFNNTTNLSITVDTTGSSNSDVKQQIVDAINNDSTINNSLTASLNSSNTLILQSNTTGESSSFELELYVDSEVMNKSNLFSVDGSNDTHIEILDKEVSLKSGSIKALTSNLTTQTSSISEYKNSLDDLAKTLVDLTSAYITDGDEYIYGENASLNNSNSASIQDISLFSGSSVNSMVFNSDSLSLVSQEDLDYLATLQWKSDISFESTNINESEESFSDFLQQLRVNVASNKESVDFKLESTQSVKMSIQSSYENLTKVDSDEELINLMQYQAAYEANAKVITVVDEMLQTILAM